MQIKEFQLSKIFEFQQKSRRKAGEGLSEGGIPFFTSSPKQSKWATEVDYNFEALILGTGGVPSVHCANNFSTSTDVFVLRTVSTDISTKYVYYFLIHRMDILERGFKGAGLKHLSREYTQKISIPLPVKKDGNPDLAEQKRIVEILEDVESLKEKRAEADQKMTAVIPALFSKMFGDPSTNPMGWPHGTLADFGASVRYGLGQPPPEDPSGIPILRATNIKKGYISKTGLMRVLREGVPVSRNAFLSADDVLVVRSGVYAGDVARVGQWAGAVAGYDLVVSPGKQFTGDFIASYLLSHYVQNGHFKRSRMRAAQPHLNSTQVSLTPVICPPLHLQKQFSEMVEEVRFLKEKQKVTTANINGLFSSLLSRAFAGEL